MVPPPIFTGFVLGVGLGGCGCGCGCGVGGCGCGLGVVEPSAYSKPSVNASKLFALTLTEPLPLALFMMLIFAIPCAFSSPKSRLPLPLAAKILTLLIFCPVTYLSIKASDKGSVTNVAKLVKL